MTSVFSYGDNAQPEIVTHDVRACFPKVLHHEWQTWFDDFNKYTAGDWVVTVTQAGSGNASEALADAGGGVLLITNDNADDDNVFMQSVGEIFAFTSGKRFFFEARFKISDATQSDIVFGLQVRDTTPLAVASGVFFQKDDGDAHLDFHVGNSSTFTDTTAIADLADNTYVKVGFLYDGGSNIYYMVNGTILGTSVVTNIPTGAQCLSFGIQNGEAVIKTMSIDYIFAASER